MDYFAVLTHKPSSLPLNDNPSNWSEPMANHTLSNGMVQDVWESRQDENGLVLFFETEELARAYLQSGREITNE